MKNIMKNIKNAVVNFFIHIFLIILYILEGAAYLISFISQHWLLTLLILTFLLCNEIPPERL